MADFKKAYAKTEVFEGGYSNHPSDKGGETYKGIARNMHPKWEGWKIIDRYKTSPLSSKQMTQVLSNSIELDDMVEAFYRNNFWNPIMGDDIMNQMVANNIYDFAVNSGVRRAVKYAQRIVGAVEDGVMGRITIKAINANIEGFVTKYKASRLAFINKIIANNSSQEVFRKGWTNRVQNA